MTANALPEQVRAFRQAGMGDYVAKPFKQADLHDAICRVVDLAQLSEAAPRVEAAGGHLALRSGTVGCH